MKAITIKQPWATLIALGEKKFETRSWRTKHRGLIAIHAGKTIDMDAFSNLSIARTLDHHGYSPLNLPTGAVIAIAEIKDCCKVVSHYESDSEAYVFSNITQKAKPVRYKEYHFGDYTEGRYAWELANVQAINPVPAKGKLSLWEWEHDE